jgi:hypothetical protein
MNAAMSEFRFELSTHIPERSLRLDRHVKLPHGGIDAIVHADGIKVFVVNAWKESLLDGISAAVARMRETQNEVDVIALPSDARVVPDQVRRLADHGIALVVSAHGESSLETAKRELQRLVDNNRRNRAHFDAFALEAQKRVKEIKRLRKEREQAQKEQSNAAPVRGFVLR